jgi:Raf kinase inhibitor-like YbhB/YbcL family protein
VGIALSDMTLSSSSFPGGGEIPLRFTQYGANVAPGFSWSDVPAATQSFALFLYDADAPLVLPDGTFGAYHWIVYNIPGDIRDLAEGDDTRYTLGTNLLGNTRYDGPMPPPGHGTHHYLFWLLALDCPPSLKPALTLPDFLRETEAVLLGMNRVAGTCTAPE